MSADVSVLVVSQGEAGVLARQLPVVVAELAARERAEEAVVLDASGEADLGPFLAEHFPSVGCVAPEVGEGVSRALGRTVEGLTSELLAVVSPGVAPHAGFLAPLVRALEAEDVAAVGSRLVDVRGAALPAASLAFVDGRLRILERERGGASAEAYPTPYPRGVLLTRRADFLGRGGFDPLFHPLFGPGGFEDVDLGIAAWRAGRAVLEVPESSAEELPPTNHLPEDLARAVREKNRLLLFWKYLDTRREAQDHLALLWRDALDAAIAGRREDLIWMALALQELPRVGISRKELGTATRALEQVLAVSDPGD